MLLQYTCRLGVFLVLKKLFEGGLLRFFRNYKKTRNGFGDKILKVDSYGMYSNKKLILNGIFLARCVTGLFTGLRSEDVCRNELCSQLHICTHNALNCALLCNSCHTMLKNKLLNENKYQGSQRMK